jgi:hypothetical protein
MLVDHPSALRAHPVVVQVDKDSDVCELVFARWQDWLWPLLLQQREGQKLMNRHAESELIRLVTMLIAKVHIHRFLRGPPPPAGAVDEKAGAAAGGGDWRSTLKNVLSPGVVAGTSNSDFGSVMRKVTDFLVSAVWNDTTARIARKLFSAMLHSIKKYAAEDVHWRTDPSHIAYGRLHLQPAPCAHLLPAPARPLSDRSSSDESDRRFEHANGQVEEFVGSVRCG